MLRRRNAFMLRRRNAFMLRRRNALMKDMCEIEIVDIKDNEVDNIHVHKISLIEFYKSIKGMNRLIISAAGGYGKTVFSKKIPADWAAGCIELDNFDLIIRLDIKKMKKGKNQTATIKDFENAVLEQYKEIQNLQPNITESLYETLTRIQDRILIIFDGLDEATEESIDIIRLFYTDHAKLENSIIITTTRPDSVHKLQMEGRDVYIYTINQITETQVEEFIRNYHFYNPLTTDQLINKYKETSHLKMLCSSHLHVAMICAIYDDPVLNKDITDVLDIYARIVALSIKVELTKPGMNNQNEEAKQFLRAANANEILKRYSKELCTFSRAVLKISGFSLTNYESMPQLKFDHSITRYFGKPCTWLTRLSLLESVIETTSTTNRVILLFSHWSIKDWFLGYLLTQQPSVTNEIKSERRCKALFDENSFAMFRCTMGQAIKSNIPPASLEDIIDYFMDSHSFNLTSHTCSRRALVVEFILYYVKFDSCRRLMIKAKIFALIASQLMSEGEGEYDPLFTTHPQFDLMNTNPPMLSLETINYLENFLDALVEHAEMDQLCEICVLPICTKPGFEDFRRSASVISLSDRWFLNDDIINKFVWIGSTGFWIIFPEGTLRHITEDSYIC